MTCIWRVEYAAERFECRCCVWIRDNVLQRVGVFVLPFGSWSRRAAVFVVIVSVLVACTSGVDVPVVTDPNDEAYPILSVRPAGAILTQPGEQVTLVVSAFDEVGGEVTFDAAAVEWRLSDSTAVTLEPHPSDPSAIVVTALTSVGSGVIAAALGEAVSNAVVVSVARVKPAVILVEDADVAFPFPDSPLPRSDSEDPPAALEVIDGTVYVAGFADSEIVAALHQVDETTMVVPVILSGDAPSVGDLLLSVGESPVLGQVEHVVTRGSHHLVHLRQVGLEDIFDELQLSFNGEDLADQEIWRDDGWVPKTDEVGLSRSGILDQVTCEYFGDGGVAPVDVTASLNTALYPIVDVVLDGLAPVRLAVGIGGRTGGEVAVDLQAGIAVTAIECKVGPAFNVSVPIPVGPLATLVSGGATLQPVVEVAGDYSGGPRLQFGGAVSASFQGTVGFDTRYPVGEMGANRISVGAPDFDPAWSASWNMSDGNVAVSVGLFVKSEVGLQLGGLALTRTCAAARWIPRLSPACESVKSGLYLEALNAKLGVKADFIRDRPTRVVSNRRSDSRIRVSTVADASLENDALNTVLNKFLVADLSLDLAKAEVSILNLYRPFEEDRIDVVSPSFTGTLAPGQVLDLSIGDEVELVVEGVYADSHLPALFDTTLRSGEIRFEPDQVTTGSAVTTLGEDGLSVSFSVDRSWCEDPPTTLHVLAFNSMLGVPTAGYLGDIELDLDCGYGTVEVIKAATSGYVLASAVGGYPVPPQASTFSEPEIMVTTYEGPGSCPLDFSGSGTGIVSAVAHSGQASVSAWTRVGSLNEAPAASIGSTMQIPDVDPYYNRAEATLHTWLELMVEGDRPGLIRLDMRAEVMADATIPVNFSQVSARLVRPFSPGTGCEWPEGYFPDLAIPLLPQEERDPMAEPYPGMRIDGNVATEFAREGFFEGLVPPGRWFLVLSAYGNWSASATGTAGASFAVSFPGSR